ncbi:MAG: HNH endonuclease [Desulfamplus sp.]|nr:HNH endonuclease [Desulfamplus sp.]
MNITNAKTLFDNISMWKRGGQRAPHKPLLILLTIAHCIQSKNRLISFSEIYQKLKELLIEFGPMRKSYRPEYPFWRLQHDGLWELTNTSDFASQIGKGDAKKSDLIKFDVHGGFSKEVYEFLISNKAQIPIIVSSILEKNFPSSIHEDILQAIGLDLESDFSLKKCRDPHFRDKILNAYQYQCAICGFNVRVGNSLVALEAAHIKWHQAGGPDSEENGIALCALHHKLFDRGAFTLSKAMKIMVSDRAYGTNGFNEWLMAFHGKKIATPQRPSFFPEPQFLSWHVREVFQGYERHHDADAI